MLTRGDRAGIDFIQNNLRIRLRQEKVSVGRTADF